METQGSTRVLSNEALLVALLVAAEGGAGIGVATIGFDWRSPSIVSGREQIFAAIVAVSLGLLGLAILQGILARRSLHYCALGLAAVCLAGLSVAGLTASVAAEAKFKAVKAKVLDLGQDVRLKDIGGHVIAGYRAKSDIGKLIGNSVVAGVYITARNVDGRTAREIGAEIAGWQKARLAAGLPPLLVAADQEGGLVSHLSPPLKRRPTLADSIVGTKDRAKRIAIALAYGRAQGAELAALGVNVNFAPVVDLNFGVRGGKDVHTRIYRRAIGRDPAFVTELAGAFCEGLRAAGVMCTLKHFPGLGRVSGDTHVADARLALPVADLEGSDLMPFAKLGREPNRMTMLSHVRLTAIDADAPVSLSGKVVTGLLRERWGHTGVLITDDITMRAAYGSSRKRGLGSTAEAAVRALNAGVDLVLISFDSEQVYPVLAALADAYGNGTLGRDQLANSRTRLMPMLDRLKNDPATRFPAIAGQGP